MFWSREQIAQHSRFLKIVIRGSHRGFSLVEVLVAAALMALMFQGLFAGFQVMSTVIEVSRGQAGATAIMQNEMEYIRSFKYDAVGTVGGVPSGTVPQFSTTTLNGVVYHERVLIQYVDDPADGVGAADTNGIVADYIQVKVEVSWMIKHNSHVESLVSNIVPPGIESTAGGGTIRVNVFNAVVDPVAGAQVEFVNKTTTSTIDTFRYTDATGVAYLSGAPAAGGYQIFVTKSGYSSDQTYEATTTLPHPNTQPIAVVAGAVSTINFQIDQISQLTVHTVGLPTYQDALTDSFADSSKLTLQSSTTVANDQVTLTNTAGLYKVNGTVESTSSRPTTIAHWYQAFFTGTTSSATSLKVSVLYDTGSGYALVPDSDLPGNSTGFTTSPIDLSSLSVASYPALALRGTLTTTDTTNTPALGSWGINYVATQATLSGIPLTIAGAKSIGTDASSNPVLKYTNSGTSDGSGNWTLNPLEWDLYTIAQTNTTYDIYELCPSSPVTVAPATNQTVTMTLGPASSHSLRVVVKNVNGMPIANAVVELKNSGIDQTQTTSMCGQTYFSSGLTAANDYTLQVSAVGYTTGTVSSVTVGSNAVSVVTLSV